MMASTTDRQSDLAASRELSRAILASLPAHIAVLDSTGMIVAVNEAWSRFASSNGGNDESVSVGTNYLDVCTSATGNRADEGTAVAEGIRAVLEGRQPTFQIEYPCHSNDKKRWFLLTAAPLRHSEGGVVVSHVDITQRRLDDEAIRGHADQLRRQADQMRDIVQQLRKSNAELDQFAYVASHDLRAPLRGIANLSRWIEEELGSAALNDEVKRMLDLLRGRVTRMEGLIDGILEYSRIGRVRAKSQRIDVGQLVNDTVDLLSPPAEMAVQVSSTLPTLQGDRLLLQQVFLNLIGNAIKHGGRSDLLVRVDCRDVDSQWVEFSVSDNGPGIEPQYHQKIFVIFQTLVARDKLESSGVGLALVKKIVEGNGGQITLESSLGKGAVFRFTWPRNVKGD